MAEVSLDTRFRGTVRLATVHLWRVAKSTDLDECLAQARGLGMLRGQDVEFIRRCLALDARLEAGEAPAEPITLDLVDELQRCVLRINTADPA